MKNFLFAVFVALFAVEISAQDISVTSSRNHDINRFYINLVGKAATLKDGWGLFGGARAGYTLNNVSVGLVGHGLIPEKLGGSYVNRDGKDELRFGYGGAEIAYNNDISDRFSLTGMLMIGAGRADYENLSGHDYFFVTEPSAAINYWLTNWFGLGCSAGYRFASGVKYADLSDANFSGWSANIDFYFGF